MTICPVCSLRQPGDDLCPLHPEASAYRDLKKQKTKMTLNTSPDQPDDTSCAWAAAHNFSGRMLPLSVTHILATICDKCGTQVTVNLCDTCAGEWQLLNAGKSRCGCNGTLSWHLHNIPTGISLEQINPSQL